MLLAPSEAVAMRAARGAWPSRFQRDNQEGAMRSGRTFSRFGLAVTAAALMAGCGGEAEEETGATAVPVDPGATAAPVTPAITPAAPADTAGGDAALIQQGQQVFTGAGNCQACHMPNGQGGPLAPNLTDSEWIWFERTPDLDQMVTLIKTGITAPKEHPAPMPAMGGGTLSDEQLRAVSLYVLSLS